MALKDFCQNLISAELGTRFPFFAIMLGQSLEKLQTGCEINLFAFIKWSSLGYFPAKPNNKSKRNLFISVTVSILSLH